MGADEYAEVVLAVASGQLNKPELSQVRVSAERIVLDRIFRRKNTAAICDIVDNFMARADQSGGTVGYQTLIYTKFVDTMEEDGHITEKEIAPRKSCRGSRLKPGHNHPCVKQDLNTEVRFVVVVSDCHFRMVEHQALG